MDVKDLRTGSALSERNNDGSKYTQGGGALPCNRNKSYQDIGSNPLAKAEAPPVRPCAVIGPDRVVPPACTDAFIKKVTIDPWLSPDNVYRRPPEYPIKPTINQNPTRNISPRQTFQENMQRIMVPPNYSALKHGEDVNYNSVQDRNLTVSKNVKPNVASEAKYCDVPYTINTLTNESKNIREAEMYVPSVNSPLTRTAPPVWPPASVVHAPRTFGAYDVYQYSQYQSCAGQRPAIIPVNRPSRVIQEEPGYPYPEQYYQDASLRYKPYPPVKERYPQARYEYISNYPPVGSFHPPSQIQPHKYDIPKPGQPHPYPVYPHLKYVENRIPDPSLEGYPRPTNQQAHYNIPFRNQVIHPTYAPIPGSIPQNKMHPYPPDVSAKVIHSNKLSFDNNNKMYIDYENSRTKTYPIADNYFVNEMSRLNPVKNQMIMPNYPRVGMPPTPTQQQYRKDNSQLRPYDYMAHYRNVEHPMNNNGMMRHPPQFSPSTLAISPTDSIGSNDTAQTQGTSQEDCGYVSQSSSASVRSFDSGMYKQHNEFHRRYEYRYSPIVGSSPVLSNQKPVNSNNNKQKQINVRQFFQMWNEGEDENAEAYTPKEIVVQTGSSDIKNTQKQHAPNQDQLYVLGLVNVPSEELSKYEHIQKISKLPENIKGYNNLELLSQFEEAIESSSTGGLKSIPREYKTPSKETIPKQLIEALPRPVSPLDVEAKISQSVIHKEVGCNFEIRPCSPKMLNVEVATPAQNVLGERVIEKVTNPLSTLSKSPVPSKADDNQSKCNNLQRPDKPFTITDNPSCKMIGSPYENGNMDSVKTNYSLHDLEINSGVCLASLPQLDNEIELNFPEVNQQFINANATKKDADFTPITDLQNKLKDDSNISSRLDGPDIVKCDTALDESEKSFTKLIKYRKIKSNNDSNPETNYPSKVIRTDSVIIKNPENIKNIENKFLEENNTPMNLSSQSLNGHKSNFEFSNTNDSDIDSVALDFTLNKPSEHNLPIIDIEGDQTTNSVTTKLSDIVVENISQTGNDFPDENITHNIIESPKNASKDNSDVPEVNETASVDNKQDINKVVTTGFQDNLITTDNDKNELTSMLNDVEVYPENVIPEKNLPESCRIEINCNNDSENVINRDNEEMADGEQIYNSEENVNLDKSYNKNDLLDDIIRSKKDKIRDSLEEVLVSSPNVSNFEDTSEKLCEDNITSDINFDEGQTIEYFKHKNLIETDEISATLEKIFEGTNNDVMSVNDKNNRFETAIISTPVKAVCNYKSKELNSPWIQKLLLYSDGLCSIGEHIIFKESTKCFDKHEEIGTCIPESSESQNMEIDDTNKIVGMSSDKGDESVVVTSTLLLEDMDESNPATDNNITSSSVENEIPNINNPLNTELEETPLKCASLTKTNHLHQDLIDLEKSDLHITDNDGSSTLENKIDADKENLNSQEIVAGISISDVLKIKTRNTVEKEECEKQESEKHSQDLINNDSVGTVAPSSEKSSTEKTTLLLNHVNKIIKEKSSDSVELTLCESGDEFIGKSEHWNTSLEVSQTHEIQNAKINLSAENLFETKSDYDPAKELQTSDLVYENGKNRDDTTFVNVSYEKPDDCDEQQTDQDENNLKQDISTIELSKLRDETLVQETEDVIPENRENNDILQSDNNVITEDIIVPFLYSENTEESVDHHIDIREQAQKDDQEERIVHDDNENENLHDFSGKRKYPLKRSYSDSDLHSCRKTNSSVKDIDPNITWPSKRQKINEMECSEQSSITGKLCSIIQNSRRNSVSAFCNEENVSFCILIDNNCIIEGEDEKICFAEIDEDCITEIHAADAEEHNIIGSINDEIDVEEIVSDTQENGLNFSNPVLENYETEKSIEESWLDDVACVETVVSDDVAEEIICSSNSSPKDDTMFDISQNSNCVVNENIDEFSLMNEEVFENICEDEPYGIPHASYDDSNLSCDDFEPRQVLYKDECLERILSESNSRDMPSPACADMQFSPEDTSPMIPEDKENIFVDHISLGNDESCIDVEPNKILRDESYVNEGFNDTENSNNKNTTDNVVHSCESSVDNVFSYKTKDDDNNFTTSSSPEVSSTTSEEKSSTLVLKITNYNGSRVSQINEINHNRPRCKFTEKKEYSHSNGGLPKRPLLTKAAQKYIPPLKETISDLKVKLSLPQQKLLKLKQLKLSKTEPKTNKINSYTIPKKQKPNFEDVLKNIDEVQIKMHKEKSKKTKPVPKVVIKKGHNGSHYTSSSNRDVFNPDLTGRKWQPWVFLEKNNFIDKMVVRNKTKAIFSHRQNTYVLAEKFKKYKSISSAKFVITHPNTGDSTKGQLKYTIRLKHTY